MTTDKSPKRWGMNFDDLLDLMLRVHEGSARPEDMPVARAWITHMVVRGSDMSGWLKKLEQAEQGFATLQTPEGAKRRRGKGSST